jgi:hypothetical protein
VGCGRRRAAPPTAARARWRWRWRRGGAERGRRRPRGWQAVECRPGRLWGALLPLVCGGADQRGLQRGRPPRAGRPRRGHRLHLGAADSHRPSCCPGIAGGRGCPGPRQPRRRRALQVRSCGGQARALVLLCCRRLLGRERCRAAPHACTPAPAATATCCQSLSRRGCPHRWHSLVNCDHGDPIT